MYSSQSTSVSLGAVYTVLPGDLIVTPPSTFGILYYLEEVDNFAIGVFYITGSNVQLNYNIT